MSISDKAIFHGVALYHIVEDDHFTAINKLQNTEMNNAYLINHNIGIYVKYSTEETSPWRFNFKPEHQDEVRDLFNNYGDKTFLVFVCGRDGICVIPYGVYRATIDENFKEQEVITILREFAGSYHLRGASGEYGKAIPINDFPWLIFQE